MPSAADREQMASDIEAAKRALDATLSDFPRDAASKLSPAEQALARVRDALIARRRAGHATTGPILDRVNLCLTLVVGMEYPQGGVKKPPLEQAREILGRLTHEIATLPADGPPDPLPKTEPAEPPLPSRDVSPSVGVQERLRATAADEKTISRRMALNVLIGVGGGAAAAVVGIPVLATGLSPALASHGANWQPVGPLAAFPIQGVPTADGTPHTGVTAAQVPVPRDDWSKGLRVKAVYVWRPSASEVVAYSRNCTDASCPVVFDAGSDCFLCPCHGGVFLKDGTAIHGPPPRPLDRYATRVTGTNLEIDLNSLPPMT
jgi:menaquinol-cytochrome c reductase iron-sulfur subunit